MRLYAPVVGVEHDDAVIAVAVGDIDLVGRRVDLDIGRAAEQRGVVAALVCGPFLPICSTNFPSWVNLSTLAIVVTIAADPDKTLVVDIDAVLILEPVVALLLARPRP